jgi:cytochrome d ubiquinol oxidase subunit II
MLLFALGGLALWLFVPGYRITSTVVTDGPSNPLLKSVVQEGGAWFVNYAAHPWMLLAPARGFLGAMGAFAGLRGRREILTLLSSKLSLFGIISTTGLSMFPFILPFPPRPQVEPDGVGQLIVSPDAVHHAGRHRRLPARGPGLYQLGVPRAPGKGG